MKQMHRRKFKRRRDYRTCSKSQADWEAKLAWLFDLRFKKLLAKAVAVTLLLTFIVDSACYGLATLPASRNPAIKREIAAALQRTQIRYAESADARRLLEVNGADCILLSSGKRLVAEDVAGDDLRLLRTIIHEDIEALMQILAAKDPHRYRAIKELVLKLLPPVRTNLQKYYPLPDYDRFSFDLYSNHIVASAFEWIVLVQDGMITASEIPGERQKFVETIRTVAADNRHTYFTPEFWDSNARLGVIRQAISDGFVFYQTASTQQAQQKRFYPASSMGSSDDAPDVDWPAAIGKFCNGKRIGIAGEAGALSATLARRLIKEDPRIHINVLLGKSPFKSPEWDELLNEHPGVFTVIDGDYQSLDALRRLVSASDAIFHTVSRSKGRIDARQRHLDDRNREAVVRATIPGLVISSLTAEEEKPYIFAWQDGIHDDAPGLYESLRSDRVKGMADLILKNSIEEFAAVLQRSGTALSKGASISLDALMADLREHLKARALFGNLSDHQLYEVQNLLYEDIAKMHPYAAAVRIDSGKKTDDTVEHLLRLAVVVQEPLGQIQRGARSLRVINERSDSVKIPERSGLPKLMVNVSFQDPDHLAGGQGWAVLNLCKAQIARGFDVVWISPCIRDEKPGEYYYLDGKLKVIKIRLGDSPILTLYANTRQSQDDRRIFGDKFVSYINEHYESSDCTVHLHGFVEVPRRALELRGRGYNVVSTFHMFLSPRIDATQENEAFIPELRSLEHEAIMANDRIIVNSTGMAEEARQLCPEYTGDICVVKNGIGDEYFEAPRQPRAADVPVISTYGRISPEKGFEIFIEAAKIVTRRRMAQGKSAVKFVVFGNNDDSIKARREYLEDLRRRQEGFDNIEIIARPEGVHGAEKFGLIDQSSIGVIPSLYEPFGLVIPEYMSRDMPIITTLTPGSMDILGNKSTGKTPYGFIVDKSPKPMADAMEWLLDHPDEARIMAQRAEEKSKEYSWASVLDETVDIYRHGNSQTKERSPKTAYRSDIDRWLDALTSYSAALSPIDSEAAQKLKADSVCLEAFNSFSMADRLHFLRGLFTVAKRHPAGLKRTLDSIELKIADLVRLTTLYPESLKADSPAVESIPGAAYHEQDRDGPSKVLAGCEGDVVVVGCGKMGGINSCILYELFKKQNSRLRLLGIVEPSSRSRKRFLDRFARINGKDPPPVFLDSIDEIPSLSGIDARKTVIYIATPDRAHRRAIKDLAAKGFKKFIVEKPIAGNEEEVDAIMRLRDKAGLNILVNEQYLYTLAAQRLKGHLERQGLRPLFCVNYGTKFRRDDYLNDRNKTAQNILYYDPFHLISLSINLFGKPRVRHAFFEDMLLPGLVLARHGSGAVFLDHGDGVSGAGLDYGIPGLPNILAMDHERKGMYAVDRVVNIFARDPRGKLKLVTVAFGDALYRYAHLEIFADDGRQESNEVIFDSPMHHSLAAGLRALFRDNHSPLSIDNIAGTHEVINQADERAIGRHSALDAAASGREQSDDIPAGKDSSLIIEPGLSVRTVKIGGSHTIRAEHGPVIAWVVKGSGSVLINGKKEEIYTGDQIYLSQLDGVQLRGVMSVMIVTSNSPSRDPSKTTSITHVSRIPDVRGGCNLDDVAPFRRQLFSETDQGFPVGLNAHLVRIDEATSLAHVHPDYGPDRSQTEIYAIIDPRDLGIFDPVRTRGAISFYLPRSASSPKWFQRDVVDVTAGSVVVVPPGVGHQGDHIYALVISVMPQRKAIEMPLFDKGGIDPAFFSPSKDILYARDFDLSSIDTLSVSQYDWLVRSEMKYSNILTSDLLTAALRDGRTYEIKYDTSRLTGSQVGIIEEYIRLLRSRCADPDTIKARPFSSAQGAKESLIAVYCAGKGFKGEGHVDVAIPDGELSDYLLRIAGMVNIALASASVPDNLSGEDIEAYRPIMSYIRNQYKGIVGTELAMPANPADILKVVRRIILNLPKTLRMKIDEIEEYNALARKMLADA